MDEQRQKFESEICRLRVALKKTDSPHLKRDYSKAIKRMIHELRAYDAFKAEVK